MIRTLARPKTLVFTLLFFSAIPILVAGLRLYQIPAGQLPEDAAKFLAVPWAHFAHALGGVLFGILGPIQFAGVLKFHFRTFHRVIGRIFVGVGMLLALSSLRLLWQFPEASTWILVSARLAAGLGLGLALVIAVLAIRGRDVARHKAWMIRAYAIGMGSATVSFILFPIYLIRAEPIEGYLSDLVFVASWGTNIAIAEWVIRGPVTRGPGAGQTGGRLSEAIRNQMAVL